MREDTSVVGITAWATEITDLKIHVCFLVHKHSKSGGKKPEHLRLSCQGVRNVPKVTS